MALVAYMKIKGAKQGEITKGASTADSIGNTYQEGHEDQSMVLEFHTEVTVPRDPQSGQPTGSRVHGPVRVIKQLDKATPLLGQAIATGEVLSEVTLDIQRVSEKGQVETFFTIKWTDAVLVHQKNIQPHTLKADTMPIPNLEEIAFTYRKVEWTHAKGGTSGSDDWRSPAK